MRGRTENKRQSYCYDKSNNHIFYHYKLYIIWLVDEYGSLPANTMGQSILSKSFIDW